MSNLSTREKVLIYFVILLLVVAIVYIAAMRPLLNAINTEKAKVAEREAQLQYYEELKASNNATKKQIEELEKTIKKQEGSLVSEYDTENIVSYVLKTLEEKGSPYLKEVNTEDIVCEDINLPDGSVANEKLLLKRVSVKYATTDGFTIPEYNMVPQWVKDGAYDQELIEQAVEAMGDMTDERFGNLQLDGYKQFIEAMKEIAGSNYKSCVRVHSITIEDTFYGFMFLNAEIDVYGTALGSSRILPANDKDQIKIAYVGNENVDCKGGMIGIPLMNFNPDNTYYMYQRAGEGIDTYVDRPYCANWSNAMMVAIYKANGTLYEDPFEKIPFKYDGELFEHELSGPQEAGNNETGAGQPVEE
ncbi:MAG: type II secretion system protein M [Clostridiales bacterium]|nr:type II secretion system protein M [Clostridiales bacterium]